MFLCFIRPNSYAFMIISRTLCLQNKNVYNSLYFIYVYIPVYKRMFLPVEEVKNRIKSKTPAQDDFGTALLPIRQASQQRNTLHLNVIINKQMYQTSMKHFTHISLSSQTSIELSPKQTTHEENKKISINLGKWK